jgi:hypothetical protein
MSDLKKYIVLLILLFLALRGMVSSKENADYTISLKEVKIEKKRCTITVRYPQIENSKKNDAREKFNKLVNDQIKTEIDRFTTYYKKESKKSRPSYMVAPWYLTINSETGMKTDKILSVIFSADVFTAGLHSQQFYITLTFDLKRGEEIKLKDLFRNGVDYLGIVSKYCIDLLKKKLKNEAPTIEEGASRKEENYRNFYLTSKGIVIIFPPYQVAAYAAGTQKVLIPYEYVEKSMRSEYAP